MMNKKELFENVIDVKLMNLEKVPELDGVYIVPQRKLHDSGYKMMNVVGHTENFDYYLLGTCSDVVDFESFFTNVPIADLHMDINKNGIIHIWSKSNKFKCTHMFSNCVFESVK